MDTSKNLILTMHIYKYEILIVKGSWNSMGNLFCFFVACIVYVFRVGEIVKNIEFVAVVTHRSFSSAPDWCEDEKSTEVEVPRPHYSEILYEVDEILRHYLDETSANSKFSA